MKMRLAVLLLGLMFSTAAVRAQVIMDGDVRYSIFGSRIRIYMEELQNLSNQTTDRLRFRVWASEDRWREYDPGRFVGFGALPRLRPLQDKDHVSRTVRFDRPPSGWYYITITLEERVQDEEGNYSWEIRDIAEADHRVYIWRSSWHPLFR